MASKPVNVLHYFRRIHDHDKHEFALRLKHDKQTVDDICIEVRNLRAPFDLRMELRLHGRHLVVLLPEHLIAEGTLDAETVYDRYGPEASLSQQHECHFLKSILASTSKVKPYDTVAMPVHGVYLHHGHRREVGFRRLLSAGSDEVEAALGKQYLLVDGKKELTLDTLREKYREQEQEQEQEQDGATKETFLEQVFGSKKKKNKWMYLFVDEKPNSKGAMSKSLQHQREARRTRRRQKIQAYFRNKGAFGHPFIKGIRGTKGARGTQGQENLPPLNTHRSRKAKEGENEREEEIEEEEFIPRVAKGARLPKGARTLPAGEKPRKHASPITKNPRLKAESVEVPFRGFVQALNTLINEKGLGLVLEVQDQSDTTLDLVTRPEKRTANNGAPCFHLHFSVVRQGERPSVSIELPSLLDAGGENKSCHLMKVLDYVDRFATLEKHTKSITLVDRFMDKTILEYLFHERVKAFGERGFALVKIDGMDGIDEFEASLTRWADTEITFKKKEVMTVREAYDAAKTAEDKAKIVALLKAKIDVGRLLLRYRTPVTRQ